MSQLSLSLHVKKRWFFWPAFCLVSLMLMFDLIRGKPSRGHVGGVMSPVERAAAWIADHCIVTSTIADPAPRSKV